MIGGNGLILVTAKKKDFVIDVIVVKKKKVTIGLKPVLLVDVESVLVVRRLGNTMAILPNRFVKNVADSLIRL